MIKQEQLKNTLKNTLKTCATSATRSATTPMLLLTAAQIVSAQTTHIPKRQGLHKQLCSLQHLPLFHLQCSERSELFLAKTGYIPATLMFDVGPKSGTERLGEESSPSTPRVQIPVGWFSSREEWVRRRGSLMSPSRFILVGGGNNFYIYN
jgi:hypothetical protein